MKEEKNKSENLIKYFLKVFGIHSFIVGITLFFISQSQLRLLGFEDYSFNFFQFQGAIFHMIMSAAYFLTIKYLHETQALLIFSILAKCTATIFLLLYFTFVTKIWLIFFSAIGDGVMALTLLILWRKHLNISTIKMKSDDIK